MDEKVASTSPYTIPIVDMTHLKTWLDCVIKWDLS